MSTRSLRPLGRLSLALGLAAMCLFSVQAGSKPPTEEQIQTELDKAQFLHGALSAHLDSTRAAATVPQDLRAKIPTTIAVRPHDVEAFATKREQEHARRSLHRINHLLTIADGVRDRDAAGALRRIEQAVREARKIEKRLGIELITDVQQEVSR